MVRRSTVTIEVDGTWDIDDLLSLSEGLMQSYGLFYPLAAPDNGKFRGMLPKLFWSDQTEVHLGAGRLLYREIPRPEHLLLRSFSYTSPGAMTLAGVLTVLSKVFKAVQALAQAGKVGMELWNKATRPSTELSSDETRHVCFALGAHLGMNEPACELVISLNGDPRSALKYLATMYAEVRKLTKLEEAGLLRLPRRKGDADYLPPEAPRALESAIEARPRRLSKPKSKPRSSR